MEDALLRFFTFNDVFLLWRAGNEAKAKAKALRTELVKKRKDNEETYAGPWTPQRSGTK